MSDNTTSYSPQKNVNIKELFTTALRYWQLLVSIIVACFLIMVIYSSAFATPMYDSTAKLYIINKGSNQITSTDFNISTYLTNDFAEILSDEVVLGEVAKELDNKYSVGALKSFLIIEATDNTRIIEIKVTTPNAKDSKKIADSICKISEEKLTEIMGLDRVKVIRNGSIAKTPSSPNLAMDALKGLIAGIVLAITLTFVISITNNKISSSEDVENILGMTVLTTVPYNQGKQKRK